jgi:hypothetical protein
MSRTLVRKPELQVANTANRPMNDPPSLLNRILKAPNIHPTPISRMSLQNAFGRFFSVQVRCRTKLVNIIYDDYIHSELSARIQDEHSTRAH